MRAHQARGLMPCRVDPEDPSGWRGTGPGAAGAQLQILVTDDLLLWQLSRFGPTISNSAVAISSFQKSKSMYAMARFAGRPHGGFTK